MYKRLEQRCSVNVKPIAACRQHFISIFCVTFTWDFPICKNKGANFVLSFPCELIAVLKGHDDINGPFASWSSFSSKFPSVDEVTLPVSYQIIIKKSKGYPRRANHRMSNHSSSSRGPSIMAATNLVPLITLLFLLDVYELIHRNRCLTFSQDSRSTFARKILT